MQGCSDPVRLALCSDWCALANDGFKLCAWMIRIQSTKS